MRPIHMKHFSRPSTLLVLALLGLSACTVTPPRVAISGPTVSFPVIAVVSRPPPPPRIEVIEQAPGRDYFWIPGYWGWHENQHVWVGGRWEPHREHEHWVAHHWDRDERGDWRLHNGHWQRN